MSAINTIAKSVTWQSPLPPSLAGDVPAFPSQSGIYCIKVAGGGSYVAQSPTVGDAIAEDMAALKRGDHHSYRLQRAWDDGVGEFRAHILELVDGQKNLHERWEHWCDILNAFSSSGFNTRSFDSATQKLQNKIRQETCTVREAANLLGVNPGEIYRAIYRHQLDVIRAGHSVLLSRQQVEWLASRNQSPSDGALHLG
jgi:excisionase family DNA binding protein